MSLCLEWSSVLLYFNLSEIRYTVKILYYIRVRKRQITVYSESKKEVRR